MANLTVFTLTGPSRGSIAHWMLEEVGGPTMCSRSIAKPASTASPTT